MHDGRVGLDEGGAVFAGDQPIADRFGPAGFSGCGLTIRQNRAVRAVDRTLRCYSVGQQRCLGAESVAVRIFWPRGSEPC